MGLFKKILGGVDVQRLVEAKDCDGLLKASAKKDPEVRASAILGLSGLGESALNYLAAKLGVSDDLQNTRSAAVLKELGWAPGTIDERILFLMGLGSWESLIAIGEEAIPPLTQIVKTKKPGDPIRWSALMAIGHFRKPETIKLMIDVFRESFTVNGFDIYFTLGCLKRMGGEAVGALAEILNDDKRPSRCGYG